MSLPVQPELSIFPIIKNNIKKDHPNYQFIGTGFFINSNGNFLTAKHVIQNNPLSVDQEYQVVIVKGKDDIKTYSIDSELDFSEKFDIVLGKTKKISKEFQSLELAKKNYPMNYNILALEFSKTRNIKIEKGKTVLSLNPSYHKGYVISHYLSDYPDIVPTKFLELSFPALRGASGAPVIMESDGAVIGMIVRNVTRELLPAHTEGETEYAEEIKFYLP